MSRIHRRLAPSRAALVIAAGLAGLTAPALAAETVVNVAPGATQTTVVTASPAAGDTVSINIGGILRQGAATNVTGIVVQGTGAGAVTINNDGRLQGRLNFPTATGAVTLHNNAGDSPVTQGWHTGGVSTFSTAGDLVDNAAGGTIATTAATTLAFGDGADRFVNAGRLIIERSGSPGASPTAGVLTLTGLEVFENSGLILMGSVFNTLGDDGEVTDGEANDRLIAQGVAFTGSGASRIGMDASLEAVTQTGCPATPTAADCIDFTGGSTAGSTLLTIRDVSGNSDGGAFNNGITLIVGSSAAGHFTLSPDSDYYAQTSGGGVLQKRLVAYHLVYDDATDSHMLVGRPADELFQASTFAATAQETWRSTTGTWFTRQADLRATPGGLADSGGLWGRVAASVVERETTASYTQGASTYDYDLGHKQRVAHLMLGADMMRVDTENTGAVIGGIIGFVRSDVEYDTTPTELVERGFTGGIYGSYLAGPLFIDGILNVNLLRMTAEVPNMNLARDVNLTQDIQSMGAQVEAGWRVDVGGGVFVEPLAGASYIRTKIDDIEIPGGGGRFDFEDKYTSLRAGAGLRAGVDTQVMGMTAAFSLTGRYWSEREGENGADAVVVGGPSLAQVTSSVPLMDDVSGGFSEIAGGLSLYSDSGSVSGFVNFGGKFADDYRSIDGSVGVRLRW